MTTMELEELVKLGLNKNEARVYISLLKFKKSDANQIIKETKFHKNIVYDNLEKLIDKGLISFIKVDGKKTFIIKNNALSNYIEEKEQEIKGKKNLAEKLDEEIKKLSEKIIEKQEALIIKGTQGVRLFYKEVLNGPEIYVFGASKNSVKIMGETFWDNYRIKRNENQIKTNMIFNQSLKLYGKKEESKYTEIKYFDKDFEPNTEIHIQGNKVAIIVWTEEPIIFLINSKSVSSSYKRYFEKMWKQAKK